MNDIEYGYFRALAQTLNFSQAAEKLFISQPALSRCISKLEQEFHTALFIRTKHDVRLTNAGMALLNNYPAVQRANRAVYDAVKNAALGADTVIQVGIQEGQMITPGLKSSFRRFKETHPHTNLNFSSYLYYDLFDQLISHNIDLALSLEFPDNIYPNLSRKTIASLNSFALVSRDHPAAKRSSPSQQLQALNGLDLMMVDRQIVPNVTSMIMDQCASNGILPANVRYAPSYLTLYDWLLMDVGFVIMNKSSVFSETNICYIPLNDRVRMNFCVYWNGDQASPALMELIDGLNYGD